MYLRNVYQAIFPFLPSPEVRDEWEQGAQVESLYVYFPPRFKTTLKI